MQEKRANLIARVFRVATALILVLSLAVALIWLIVPDRINLEPTLVVLGLLYSAVPLAGRWLVGRLEKGLRRERLTLPYALAYGYLTNYLAPVVRELRKRAEDPSLVTFYVYIPRALDELQGDSISDILGELANQAYDIQTVELTFEGQKRSRDIRTARKLTGDAGPDGAVKYFDFPTTLLTLEPAVDYRLTTKEDSFPYEQRDRIGSAYIAEFRTQLERMLATRPYASIRDHVKIVAGGYDFLDPH